MMDEGERGSEERQANDQVNASGLPWKPKHSRLAALQTFIQRPPPPPSHTVYTLDNTIPRFIQ